MAKRAQCVYMGCIQSQADALTCWVRWRPPAWPARTGPCSWVCGFWTGRSWHRQTARLGPGTVSGVSEKHRLITDHLRTYLHTYPLPCPADHQREDNHLFLLHMSNCSTTAETMQLRQPATETPLLGKAVRELQRKATSQQRKMLTLKPRSDWSARMPHSCPQSIRFTGDCLHKTCHTNTGQTTADKDCLGGRRERLGDTVGYTRGDGARSYLLHVSACTTTAETTQPRQPPLTSTVAETPLLGKAVRELQPKATSQQWKMLPLKLRSDWRAGMQHVCHTVAHKASGLQGTVYTKHAPPT